MALVDFVAFFAWASAATLHITPDAFVLKIHKTPTLLVLLATNAWLWMLYGWFHEDTYPLVSCFAFVVVSDATSIVALYRASDEKLYLRKTIGVASVFLVLATVYATTYLSRTGQTRFQAEAVVGFTAALLSFVLLYSPLRAIRLAIHDCSNAAIPIDAVVLSTVNSILWTVLCLMRDDWFLLAASGSALVLDLVQVACYAAFRPHHDYVSIA